MDLPKFAPPTLFRTDVLISRIERAAESSGITAQQLGSFYEHLFPKTFLPPPLPPDPTTVPPGPLKVGVMEQRARAGTQPLHPEDTR